MRFITTVLVFLACFAYGTRGQSVFPDTIFNADSIQKIVAYLASDSLKGRLTGTKEIALAADFIAAEFKRSGLQPWPGVKTAYQQVFEFDYFNTIVSGTNVVGMLPGKSKPTEFIIFSAHFDHLGTDNSRVLEENNNSVSTKDSIYNGANDNASGTAAVILLARYFALQNSNERTLVFICFSGEEFQFRGSTNFRDQIPPENIVAMINIEMIGRGRNRKDILPYVTGDSYSDLRTLLNQQLKKQAPEENGKRIEFRSDNYYEERLFARSDNYPFALKGVPAHTIMLTMPGDTYYHTQNDEVETLNFKNMAVITRAIAKSCLGLVMGTDTPRRINPDRIK